MVHPGITRDVIFLTKIFHQLPAIKDKTEQQNNVHKVGLS